MMVPRRSRLPLRALLVIASFVALVVLAAPLRDLAATAALNPKPKVVAAAVDDFDPDEFAGAEAVAANGADNVDADSFDDMDDDAFSDTVVDAEDAADASQAANAAEAAAPIAREAAPKRSYTLESIAVAALVLYGLNFLYGSRKNSSLAHAWVKSHAEFLVSQFAQVGISGDIRNPLMKESQSQYKLFCSGRRHCVGMMCDLQLAKRHDLISVLMGLVQPSEDVLTLDIPMNEEEMENFVFAVVRRSNRKAMHSELRDLQQYAKLYSPFPAGVDLEVLSDCYELVHDLLQGPRKQALIEHQDLVIAMHFTDQAPVAQSGSIRLSRKALRFQFKLPSADRMSELHQLVEMAVHFVDVVGATKLSFEARRSALAARKKSEVAAFKATHEQRMQDRKAREEAEYAKLTAKEQRRRDEIQRKKRERKRMPRMKMKAV